MSSAANTTETFRKTQELATQGNPQTQYDLSEMYREGTEGVAKNDALCFEWLLKSANGGYAEAQYFVGYNYATKKNGAPYDRDLGFQWFEKAAAQGYEDAINEINTRDKKLAALRREETEEQVQESLREERAYFEKHYNSKK